jgi:hypothetical protein
MASKTIASTNCAKGAKINTYMKKNIDPLKELWQVAQQYPYIEKKFSTCERDYTPSFKPRQVDNFTRTEIKQIGAPRKNRTFI